MYHLKQEICIAKAKLEDAGAKLVQIYTGFIYKGPSLIQEIKALG